MPTILNPILTLNEVSTGVEIVVNYRVKFTPLERNLANLGMVFEEQVDIIGIDPPRSGRILATLVIGQLQVSGSPNPLPISHTKIVPRALLDEDPSVVIFGTVIPDNDEIRCRIGITAKGLPDRVVQEFTNQFILFEDPVRTLEP